MSIVDTQVRLAPNIANIRVFKIYFQSIFARRAKISGKLFYNVRGLYILRQNLRLLAVGYVNIVTRKSDLDKSQICSILG